MTDKVVARLYEAVVDAVRERGVPDGPVKVADLYREIVPYRAVRSALGVELNADYEHAMLRLLAGERGLLRLEPETARRELRREVDEPYPSVGRFREFAGSDVWITLPDDDGSDPADAADSDPTTDTLSTPEPEAPEPIPAPETTESTDAPGGPDSPDAATPGTCAACGFDLPVDREAHYCPACGADQRVRPCVECGEILEADWRFCIACGRDNGT